MMDATASALLQKIALNLEPLENLTQLFRGEMIAQFSGAMLAGLVAIFVALCIDDIRRRLRKSRLVPKEVIAHFQNFQYVYRLVLENESIYKAKNVEVDVVEIYDNGDNLRENFVPSPMNWTHRDASPRDIYPNQTVNLDIINVVQTPGKYIKLAAPNLEGLEEIPYLRQGNTKIILRYYQENGQTGEIPLSVSWNGIESFEEGLPEVRLISD